jgi:hypothetical protein
MRKLLIFIACYSFLTSSLFAQCGWVGEMNKPGGPINAGSEYLVNVQVWKDGVTNSSGQGGGITCFVRFAKVSAFGAAWDAPQTAQMNYDKDTGNNDEYKLNIGPNLSPAGLWEYNCYCICSGSSAELWNGNGNGQLTVNAPAPVTLQHFEATNSTYANRLIWSTASETNNDYFEVLHSSTGKDWQVLGMVKGAGNSNTTQEYSFVHNTPAKGKSFYRLRQVDYDGKYEYSPIRSVVSQGVRKEISLAPNPASDLVSIIHDGSSTTFDISIRDITGRTITEYKNFSAETLDISPLSSGLYTITITSDGVTTTQRLIKE